MAMIRILLSTKLGELRWTQADLARATGIRPSTINEYYHELAERVNLEHLDLPSFRVRIVRDHHKDTIVIHKDKEQNRA